jgi:hypothetical protein
LTKKKKKEKKKERKKRKYLNLLPQAVKTNTSMERMVRQRAGK